MPDFREILFKYITSLSSFIRSERWGEKKKKKILALGGCSQRKCRAQIEFYSFLLYKKWEGKIFIICQGSTASPD